MHASRTLLLDALERQSVIVVQHSCRRTEPRHSCGTLLRDTLVGPRGTLVGTLRRRFCATALNWEDTLFKCSWGTLVKKKNFEALRKLFWQAFATFERLSCGTLLWGTTLLSSKVFSWWTLYWTSPEFLALRQSLKSPTTVLQGGGSGQGTAQRPAPPRWRWCDKCPICVFSCYLHLSASGTMAKISLVRLVRVVCTVAWAGPRGQTSFLPPRFLSFILNEVQAKTHWQQANNSKQTKKQTKKNKARQIKTKQTDWLPD